MLIVIARKLDRPYCKVNLYMYRIMSIGESLKMFDVSHGHRQTYFQTGAMRFLMALYFICVIGTCLHV